MGNTGNGQQETVHCLNALQSIKQVTSPSFHGLFWLMKFVNGPLAEIVEGQNRMGQRRSGESADLSSSATRSGDL